MLLANLFPVLLLRVLTFLVWALAAASAAYWGLRLWAAPSAGLSAPVVSSGALPSDAAMVARVLGATRFEAPAMVSAPLSSRFSLIGMVAGGSRHGVALIAMDGKPAKPVLVGAALEEGLILQSVEPRRAVLAASSDGPALFVLELPGTRK